MKCKKAIVILVGIIISLNSMQVPVFANEEAVNILPRETVSINSLEEVEEFNDTDEVEGSILEESIMETEASAQDVIKNKIISYVNGLNGSFTLNYYKNGVYKCTQCCAFCNQVWFNTLGIDYYDTNKVTKINKSYSSTSDLISFLNSNARPGDALWGKGGSGHNMLLLGWDSGGIYISDGTSKGKVWHNNGYISFSGSEWKNYYNGYFSGGYRLYHVNDSVYNSFATQGDTIPPVISNVTVTNHDNVSSVSLGNSHSAAITKDGSLYTWGSNWNGQLGNGTTADSSKPIKIMNNVLSVNIKSGGISHSAAITKDGSLYTWGNNIYGQLGDGTTENSSKPIKIMENVSSVSLGSSHSAIITKDGSLYIWGWNGDGQLGNGATADSSRPIKIMENVSLVSLGGCHSAAITKDGSLYTWGWNGDGQLGNGATADSSRPIKIMENVSLVSLGSCHSAAITKDGSLYTWGNNAYGQLGDGTTENSSRPIKIMENVLSVDLGARHSAAITKDGSLYTWGSNWNGELGNGTTADSSKPIKIMDNVSSVGLGNFHSAAITKDGSLYIWGWNGDGQLGDGTINNSSVPIKVNLGLDNVQPDKNEIPEGPKTWEGKAGTEGFVYRLYNVAMCREADEAGFNDWNNKLKSRQKTAAEVAQGFIFSEEFKNFNYNNVQYVKMLYRTMFGREADEGGLNGWVSDLENGMSREYVYHGFAESQEFSNLCNSYGVIRGTVTLSAYRDKNAGATGFIARLYTKMLGRAYDDDGLEYWCRKYLTGENTIEEVASIGFLHSQELANQNLSDTEFVTRMYRTFLNREPDEAGLADWVNRLKTGRETRDSLVYGFTQSKEFYNIKSTYGL